MKKMSYVIAIGCCIAVVLLMLRKESFVHAGRISTQYSLPQPTGTYAVGTTSRHLIDTSRHEYHSKSQDAHRELMIQLWYPAQIRGSEQKSSYAEPAVINGLQEWINKAEQIPFEELSHLFSLKSHALIEAPVALKQAKYPVLIFSPGFGGPVAMYTALLEELASQGYIILGINYPYVTDPVVFPDGRVIKALEPLEDQIERRKERAQEYQTWMHDITFVIDQLMASGNSDPVYQTMDLNSIGVFGHSFGGAISLALCQSDNRIKAGADLDGKLQPWNEEHTLSVPFLFIVAEHSEKTLQPMKQLVNITIPRPEYVALMAADHGSFTDLYLVTPWNALPKLDPVEGIQITRKLLVDFFGKHLKNTE